MATGFEHGTDRDRMSNKAAVAALLCGIVGLAVPLAGAVPLVVFTRRDGDLLPGFVVALVGIVVGAAGIVFGVIGRRSAEPGTSDRRRASLGAWLGAFSILAGAILFVVLVEAAVSAFEF